MSQAIYENLKQRISACEMFQRMEGTGVSDDVIAIAEQKLDITFPPSYRWFLKTYGAGYISGYELEGLCPDLHLGRFGDDVAVPGDIVATAQANAEIGLCGGLTDRDYLQLFSLEGDEIYYFDINAVDRDGEMTIVCTMDGDEFEPYASSFAGFLDKMLHSY